MKRRTEFRPETLDALIRLETELAFAEPRTLIEPSPSLDARVRAIDVKARVKRLSKRVVRLLVAAAVVLALTVTAAATPAVRQFVLHVFTDHTRLETPAGNGVLTDLVLPEVPAGFTETERERTRDAIVVRYESGSDWFTLTKSLPGGWFGFDTEETGAREFDVNGVRHVAYAPGDNIRGVIRYDGAFVYAVSGTLDEDALTRIVDAAG